MSKVVEKNAVQNLVVGTIYYVAPEVIKKKI